MTVDLKKFERDANRLRAEYQTQRTATRTGATEVITAALPIIDKLRDKGVPWAAIAGALAAQGVVQGADRRPLSGRRLCALLSAIRKREERHARKARARRARADLAPRRDAGIATLTPELLTDTRRQTSLLSESELRHEAFANLQLLLKGQRQ